MAAAGHAYDMARAAPGIIGNGEGLKFSIFFGWSFYTTFLKKKTSAFCT